MTEAEELRVVALVLEGERERAPIETVLARVMELGVSETEARRVHARVLARLSSAARLPEVEQANARARFAESRYGLDEATRVRARWLGALATIAFVLGVVWWAVRRLAALRN